MAVDPQGGDERLGFRRAAVGAPPDAQVIDSQLLIEPQIPEKSLSQS
jgi:hypothetical protein